MSRDWLRYTTVSFLLITLLASRLIIKLLSLRTSAALLACHVYIYIILSTECRAYNIYQLCDAHTKGVFMVAKKIDRYILVVFLIFS